MNSWFDPSLLSLNAGQTEALLPYLWLCFGIAIATVAAGFRLRVEYTRVLHSLILLPYAYLLVWAYRDAPQTIFGTSLEVTTITRIVGASVGVFALLAGLFSGHPKSAHSEWSPLMLIGVLGMSLLPGARDWVAFFVFLETLAIAGYVLTALDYYRESSLEAGLKYLLMGAFASALLLMGMTLLYGVAGSFDYALIRSALPKLSTENLILAVTGACLLTASLGFKVALVPFHMWAPDVYQAAPSGPASFLATATKTAVFAAAAVAFDRSGLWSLPGIRSFVEVLAILSVIGGNLLAAAQKTIRRVLAYSSVANAGYAALALSVGVSSTGSMITSLAIYGVSVIAAFAMVEALCQATGQVGKFDIELSELRKVTTLAPGMVTAILSISLFSLAGIPPFPGFLGKYVVLADIWSAGFRRGAAVLLIGTLLGLAYYLRLFVPLYMEKDQPSPISSTRRISRSPLFAGFVCVVVLALCLSGFSRMHQWLALVEVFAR